MTLGAPVIYLVDNDPSFLRATSRMLTASGFNVKAFGSAGDFLEGFDPADHGCVLADLDMPKMNGLELQIAITRAGHAIPVVFLTGHGDIESSVLAMRNGAEDFVTKRASKEALLAAIKRALACDARLRELRAPFEALTPRDCEVLAYVLKGRLNKQIAMALNIDERSVKRHRSNIMTKLRIDSVAALLDMVHAAGLQFEIPAPAPSSPPPSSPRP